MNQQEPGVGLIGVYEKTLAQKVTSPILYKGSNYF
jgi:hypothetical protein